VKYDNFEFDLSTLDLQPHEYPYLAEFTLSFEALTCSVRRLSATSCEFPISNSAFTGRRSRWAWALVNSKSPGQVFYRSDAIVKFDLWVEPGSDAEAGRVTLPQGCFVREPQFAPRWVTRGSLTFFACIDSLIYILTRWMDDPPMGQEVAPETELS